jgi:hypothetical protein
MTNEVVASCVYALIAAPRLTSVFESATAERREQSLATFFWIIFCLFATFAFEKKELSGWRRDLCTPWSGVKMIAP